MSVLHAAVARPVALAAAGALALLGLAAGGVAAAPAHAEVPVIAVTGDDFGTTNASADSTKWDRVAEPGACPALPAAATATPWALDIENKPEGSWELSDAGLTIAAAATPLPAGTKVRFQHYLASGAYPFDAADVTLSDLFASPLSWSQTLVSGATTYGATLQIQLEKSDGTTCDRVTIFDEWAPGTAILDLGADRWIPNSHVATPGSSASALAPADLLAAFGDYTVVSFGPNLGRDTLDYAYRIQDLTVLGSTLHFTADASTTTSRSIDFAGYALGDQLVPSGWYYQSGKTKPDYGFVDTAAYPDSGLSGRALRISNAVTVSQRQLGTPPLAQVAGVGPSAGAYNTFDASFTVASATGGLQPGTDIEVALDGGSGHPYERTGGVLYLRHIDAGLQISWMGFEKGTTDTWPTDATIVDATVPHDISIELRMLPGDDADVVVVSVDGVPMLTGTSWAGYYMAPNAVRSDQGIGSLMFRAAGSAPLAESGPGTGYVSVPEPTAEQKAALAGQGLLFTDIAYSVTTKFVTTPPPTISGGTALGSTLTALPPAWLPAAESMTYEWHRDGVPVGTGVQYTIGVADLGHSITVVATGQRSGFPVTSAESAPFVVPAPGPDEPEPAPPTLPSTDVPPPAPSDSGADGDPIVPPTLPSTPPAPGGALTVSYAPGTFLPYEWVQFVVYSVPAYAGSIQAGADGSLSGTLAVPSGVPAGAHTLAATGTSSGVIVTAGITVAAAPVLAATGVDARALWATGGAAAAVVLWGAAALLGAAARRRAG